MASHKSAEKRTRQEAKRRARNRSVRSGVGSATKRVRRALARNDGETARTELGRAERALRKAASKGVLHPRTASRRVARLARAVHRSTRAQS